MCKLCLKKMVAEFLGTLILVLFGCGSAVLAGIYIGNLGIAMTFGLTLMFLVYAIGGLSGCHVNPAVTIGFLAVRRISGKEAVRYIVAQFFGGIAGAALLYAAVMTIPGYSLAVKGLGQNFYGDLSMVALSPAACFFVEMVLTAVFVFVICSVTAEKTDKASAGLAIGVALLVIHLIAIPLTGTSVNPARSLGPALMVGRTALAQVWMFLVAPVIGGIIGAFLWKATDSAGAVCKG